MNKELECTAASTDAMETAKHLVTLAAAALSPFKPNDAPQYAHMMVPEGYKLEDISKAIEKTLHSPHRKAGTVQLKSVDSLIDYAVQQSATHNGYIYADPDTCTLTAVFNDHHGAIAGWRDHRAVVKLEFSPEFQTWKGNNKQPKAQDKFAEFIEDNLADLSGPESKILLDVATTIAATTGINFSSAKRLQNGQSQLIYQETIDAKAGADGKLAIPQTFQLGLRIFKNADAWQFTARLKYRLASGGISFHYELDRPERVVETAFAEYTNQVREKSGYTVLIGTPGQ